MDYSIEFLGYRKKLGEPAMIVGKQMRNTKWHNALPTHDDVFDMPIIDLREGPHVPSETKEIAVWGVFVADVCGIKTAVEAPSMKYFTEDYPLDEGEEWSDELQKAFYEKVTERLREAVRSSLVEIVVEVSA